LEYFRIVDENGKDVKPGDRGEVLVKGPVVTKGYHNNPKATKDAFVDGWFCTGDVALIRSGLIYIVDRKKATTYCFYFGRPILTAS
jgi:4-coumarate--CoA ligase